MSLKGHISTVFSCINDKIICQNIISTVIAFNYNKNRAVPPYIQHSVHICDFYVIFHLHHLCEHIKKTVWNKISDQRNKFRICAKLKLFKIYQSVQKQRNLIKIAIYSSYSKSKSPLYICFAIKMFLGWQHCRLFLIRCVFMFPI